jgi:ubiquinone/menaquinone biosynthesis C-methylase UbiE
MYTPEMGDPVTNTATDSGVGDSLRVMREDWNRRARENAYYYVAFIDPHQGEDGFSRSAAEVISELESELPRLEFLGDGVARRRALEIGCGPGRLVLPMSRHFEEIYGVDISDEMIHIARERLQAVPNAHFLVNSGGDLALFEDDYFSFVYSFIVFQHIPSKDVVLNYLREIQRVLVPGGITRFQVRGAPPSKAGLEDSITWNGCVVLDTEIEDFARQSGMELVAITGEQTQYLWVTLRKRPQPVLQAVTSSSGDATKVPQRGPGAAISLWIEHAPAGADLTSLSAQIRGQLVRGSYLSPKTPKGGCQINVTLPRDLGAGDVEIALVYEGKAVGAPRSITVEPAVLVPRVTIVCDAVNVAMKMRSESGGLKVVLEDLEDPTAIEFRLGGTTIRDVDVTCTNLVLSQYLFSFLLPIKLKNGALRFDVYFQGRLIYQAEVEVGTPVIHRMADLGAVTSAFNGSTAVSQSGPHAAISLWIKNAPHDADLTMLSARINGQEVSGSFLSELSEDGGCQMNVFLPPDLPLGDVQVALVQTGEAVGTPHVITIEAAPLVPTANGWVADEHRAIVVN